MAIGAIYHPGLDKAWKDDDILPPYACSFFLLLNAPEVG
jgi:hypothetical protein